MAFDPRNTIIKLCIQGMEQEEKEKSEDALKIFIQAWNEATNDFEKFMAAYYVARNQNNTPDKLKWTETALTLSLKVNDESVNGALPALYSTIAKCYEQL